jgi:hypothetical protein
MKVGDKYYCVKDVITRSILIYKTGKSYTISDISIQSNNECVIFSPVEYNTSGYTGKYIIIDKYSNNIIDGHEWSVLDNHFITEKEIRKQKLEKINESR